MEISEYCEIKYISSESLVKMISKRKFVSVDPIKCIGCSVCEYVCSLEKEWSFNPLRSRIRVMRLHPLFSLAMVCRFCEEAPCVHVCPRNALKQAEKGVILIDEDLCNGCGWCIPACKYGAITMNPERNVVMICDLCDGEPKCIEFCPEEALELMTEDEATERTSLNVKKLLSELSVIVKKVKKGEWQDLYSEMEDKLWRLEEKLAELSRKELEIYEKAQEMEDAEKES